MSATLPFALACVVLAAVVNGQFLVPVPKYSKCPTGDTTTPMCHEFRETWCMFGRGDCRSCAECTSCGMYRSAPCSKNLANSGSPCLLNYVVLPALPGEPPRCGCAPGTFQALNGVGGCVPLPSPPPDVVPSPPPADFSVAPYAKCPATCAPRASFCTQKTTCTTCSSCVICGIFGSQPCPFILLSSGGNCKNNYQVLPPSLGKPYSSCGCKKPTTRDPVLDKCVKLTPAPPSPPVKEPKRFFRLQYQECPTACDGRTAYCTRRKSCRKCGQCSLCGGVGSQPCPKVLIGSGQVCASNYVLLPPTAPGAPQLCGCKSGFTSVNGMCVRAPKPPPIASPPPPVYSAPAPAAARTVRSLVDKPVSALGMSAVRNSEAALPFSFSAADSVTPFTVDAAAPIKTLRFEQCPSGCGSRAAFCTNADSCDSCTSCTLCGLPGGQPCPLEAFTSGARCLNNLEIVAPTQETPRHTCGCHLPNVLDAATNACVIHA